MELATTHRAARPLPATPPSPQVPNVPDVPNVSRNEQGAPMNRLTYNDLRTFAALTPYLADLDAILDDARREGWLAGWTDAEECYGLTTEQARAEAHDRKLRNLTERHPEGATS